MRGYLPPGGRARRGPAAWGRLALLFALLASAHASADVQLDRARALFRRAEVHFRLGEFDRALALYKEAYRTKQLPEFLFNIGQCHRQRGDCRTANFYFWQFVNQKPGAAERPQVEELIRECEARLRQESSPSTGAAQETPGPGARRRLSPAWFWSAVGLTGALFATAAATGLVARAENDEYLDPATPVDRRRELKDEGEALEVASWTTFGLGAAALSASVMLYFFTYGPAARGARPSTERDHATSARVVGLGLSFEPTAGGAAIGIDGRF